MKYTITHNQINESIKTLAKIATKNSSLPILKTIKMEVVNGVLTLSATNLDVGAVINIPTKDSIDGVCAIDASVLLSYVGLLPQKTKISIEKDGEYVVIRSEKGVAKFMTVDPGDFPEIPKINNLEANRVTIKSSDFVGGLKSVVFSCAVSAMRPELASVYIYKKDEELVFVATDTFRLSEKRIPVKNVEIESILIPAKVAQEVIKLFADFDGNIDIYIEDGQISIQNDGVVAVARTISGNFPDYKQIIPDNSVTTVDVIKGDLQNALRASTIFSDKFNQVTVSVDSEDKKMILDTKNTTSGENSYDIQVSVVGESVSLNFNYGYFVDVLPIIGSDSVRMIFNGVGKPVVIKDDAHKFLYLVMPMSKN